MAFPIKNKQKSGIWRHQCFGEINDPLKQLFNLLLENGTFPEKINIAKVTRFFKNGDLENITSYRPISVRPCFLYLRCVGVSFECAN